MTLDEFRASGRNCDNLAQTTGNTLDLFTSNSGRVYGSEECPLYIEALGDRNDGRGARWYTIVERSEYESEDLAPLEKILYEFAVDAGYITQEVNTCPVCGRAMGHSEDCEVRP